MLNGCEARRSLPVGEGALRTAPHRSAGTHAKHTVRVSCATAKKTLRQLGVAFFYFLFILFIFLWLNCY
jgi:hypothetical protein